MSLPDFQKAFASLIASPALCKAVLADENAFFADYDLTEKEKTRIHSVLRQRGISACCTLYRMNRITPIYTQLSNTSALLGDDFVPLADEFWQQHANTTLQFRDEVSKFGELILQKIEKGIVKVPYLKDVLLLEMVINELSYLPEGEVRLVKFDHDIFHILSAINDENLSIQKIETSNAKFHIYMKDLKLQMDVVV